MQRSELIKCLTALAKAVGDPKLIEALGCFFFEGDQVVAYDDIVGIWMPLDVTIKGGVPAPALLSLLRSLGVKEVELTQKKDKVVIQAGKGRYTLPFYAGDTSVFTPPDTEDWVVLEVPEAFVKALEAVRVSVGENPTFSSRMGVTFAFEKDAIWLYSTDEVTVSRAVVDTKVPKALVGVDAALPREFVDRVVECGSEQLRWKVENGSVKSVVSLNGSTGIFCRCHPRADSNQFELVVDRFLPHENYLTIPIPKGLDTILERASIVLDVYSVLTVKDGVGKVHTTSAAGEMQDELELGTNPDAEVWFDPAFVRRALAVASSMLVLENVIVLSGDGFLHLVAPVKMEE